MLQELKESFLELIKGLGYNITDNGRYKEEFPWLMLKTSNRQWYASRDIQFESVSFVVDIFSTYTGEKEIVDISENIIEGVKEWRWTVPFVTSVSLRGMRIIDDKETGPVRKHGILTFSFLLTTGLEDYDEETNPIGP